jgi:NADPH:quinone reductase-like Zn-dependent oxidoreductase
MRAVSYAEFGGPEVLHVADLPVPQPEPGQVRVRVTASVVHPVDLMVRAGRFPAPLPTGLPYVPGWDVAGRVDALGPSVGDLALDDDVIGFSPWVRTTAGAHAEYVILEAAWLTAAPTGIPATEAATLPTNGLAAVQALDLLALPTGSSVLVTGAAGQVGGFTLALARVAGLHATGIAGADDREFVESQGAAFVPRSDDPIAVAPGGFDAVVDMAVLGPSLMDLVRDGGGYVAASPPLRPEPVRGSGRLLWTCCRTAPGWATW